MILSAVLTAILMVGCDSAGPPNPSTDKKSVPAQEVAKPDTGAWHIYEPDISPIDGTRTLRLSTGGDGSKLYICSANGKLCGGGKIGVFVTSPCWVVGGDEFGEQYERRVRLRFDSDKFIVDTWGISDDHEAIHPHAPKQFISTLKKHKTLAVEFGCDRSDSGVVIFNLQGLQAALDAAGLKL